MGRIVEALHTLWGWLMLAMFLWVLWCLFSGNIAGLDTGGVSGWEF